MDVKIKEIFYSTIIGIVVQLLIINYLLKVY